MQAAISSQRTARNLPCWPRYVLHVSQMMFETADIDECTGRLRVWMYCIQPKTMPPRHTTRPIRRTADPVRDPPMNDTAFRSGILMSDSLARRDGTEDTANAAAAPNCQALGNFMLKGRGLVWREPAKAAGSGRVYCKIPALSLRPLDRV